MCGDTSTRSGLCLAYKHTTIFCQHLLSTGQPGINGACRLAKQGDVGEQGSEGTGYVFKELVIYTPNRPGN